MISYKKLAVAAALTLSASVTSAQTKYVKFGGTYNLPTNFSYQEQLSEAYNTNGAKLTYSLAKQNFGKGFCLNSAFGYMFRKHLGAEMGISYHFNSKNKWEDFGFASGYGVYSEYHRQQESYSRLLLLQPSLVVSLGREKLNPYGRLGLVLPFGKIHTTVNYIAYKTDEKVELETKGAFRVGFQQAVGFELEARKNVYLFAEITCTNLSFAPETRTVVKATLNGEDLLPQLTVRDRETEFVETVTEKYSYSPEEEEFVPIVDWSKPFQALRKNYSLNNLGFGLGLKVNL